jgi:outer membrane protein assembly factor BamB
VYAEPVVIGSLVIVATENDTVYALDANSGGVVWQRNLATPAPLSLIHQLGANCGNIDPLGITGTPVIDPVRAEVFVATEIASNGSVSHQLFGLSVRSGAVMLSSVGLDPAGPNGLPPYAEQQRAALALGNGRVYVTYGGLAGDCGPYRGAVVSVTEDGASFVSWIVPTTREGGIWAPSGPAIDASGNVFVAIGNGAQIDSTQPFDGSDSVTKLSPTLNLFDWFAPTTWADDNRADLDLGSAGPELLANNQVFQVGKSGVAYLLDANNLGHIGGQIAAQQLCTSFGGQAYAAPTIFVACTDGVRAVRVNASGNGFDILWQGPSAATGPPIVGGGLVWVVGNDDSIYGLDPATGLIVAHLPLSASEHFTTPTVAAGKLIVATSDTIQSFGPATAWSAWRYQPGPPPGVTGAPAVSSWGPGRLDLFVRGRDNNLWHSFKDPGTGFSGWENLGGVLTSAPAAASWAPNRVDVFVRGTDDGLWHKWYDIDGWHPWEPQGGVLASSPAVTSWGSGRLDIVTQGTDHGVWHKWYDVYGWHAWESRGGVCTGDVGVGTWGPYSLDIFCIGGTSNTGPLWHTFYRGQWIGWVQEVPGLVQDGVSAESWGLLRLDVFGVDDPSAVLSHDWYDSGGWHHELLDGVLAATPAAASWSFARIDVFTLGVDGQLYHKSYG